MMNNYDAVTMRLTDISLNVKDCILDMSKSVAVPKDQIKPLIPMVRTAAEMPRQTGLLENLVAMIKRNFNAPELSGIIDIENTASLVVDKFFDSYLLKEKRKPNKNVSLFSRESLNRWLEKQEQVTIGQLADFDFVDLPAVDQYRHDQSTT